MKNHTGLLAAFLYVITLIMPLQFSFASDEPAFCKLDNFLALERSENIAGLVRQHKFVVGDLTLIGLAVGDSNVESTKAVANKYSSYEEEEKFCTFYYNKGKVEQERSFNHHYVSLPALKFFHGKLLKEYETVLRPIFEENAVTLVSCAKDHGYVAMGCNGQKHRGPSVFAMFLSYAGCKPKNAVKIANKLWGKNFVFTKTREKLAAMAYEWGDENRANREMLQSVMLGGSSSH